MQAHGPEGSMGPTPRKRKLPTSWVESVSFRRLWAGHSALKSWPSHSLRYHAPNATNCPSAAFSLAILHLMAYGQEVMSLTETISSANDCPGRKRLSKPEGRVSRRTLKRHCAAHAVPEPYAMRDTIRSVRVRRICTAWGVGHPDEP